MSVESGSGAGRERTVRMASEDRRTQLLDCAVEELLDQGFGQVTVEAIAQRAGVTRPVVYDMFGDLDTLLLAVIDRAEQQAVLALLRVVGFDPPSGMNPDAFLMDSVTAFLRAVREDPRTWRLVLMPPPGHSPELRRRIDSARLEISGRIQALLDWGLPARGGPLGLDTELLAPIVAAIGEDAARLMLSHPRAFTPARLSSAAAELLALLVPGPAPDIEPPAHAPIPPPAPADAIPVPDPPSVAAGRRRVPQAERREQLLDIALGIIAQEGFPGLTIEAIARRAGVNRVVIYRSFANLPLLVTALMHREDVRVRGTLNGLIPQNPTGYEPRLVLHGALTHLLAAVASRPQTWRLALLRPENAPRILQRIVNRRRTALAKRIEPLVEYVIYDPQRRPSSKEVEIIARMLLTIGEEQGRLALSDPAFTPERLLGGTWQVLCALALPGAATTADGPATTADGPATPANGPATSTDGP